MENYGKLMQKYYKEGDYTKACIYADKHIKACSKPTPMDYNYAGCAYNSKYMSVSNKTSDAVKSYYYFEKASDMAPDNHLYAKNATIMASKINSYEGGKKHWNRLFKMDTPFTYDDKYDYAAFCLKNGDLKGWGDYFDFRFQKETTPTKFPEIYKPKWRGENIKDKTLLVFYEQGFGDTILMYGYMKRLKELCSKLIFVVQKNLYTLLKDNSYGVEIIPVNNKDLNKLQFDCYIPSMSIPIVLKLDKKNLSVGENFIEVNNEDIKKFKQEYLLNNNKINIGLSVRGSVTGDRTRDVDSESIKLLNKLPSVNLYNLTKDIDPEYYKNLKVNKVIDLSKDFKDFKDTACAIKNMDFVISTDNVLLNLAGAVGAKTYGLFNYNNQFRWFDLKGKDVVWLTSVKPFVNDTQNNWAFSLEKVIKEIRKEIKKRERG